MWRSRQCSDESFRVQPHEAGIAEEVDLRTVEGTAKRLIEILA